jgi:hypothetical protein
VKPSDLPVVSTVFDSGADDRVFDTLLLIGPLVILLVAAAGRTVVTELLVTAYLAVFIGHTLYLGTK